MEQRDNGRESQWNMGAYGTEGQSSSEAIQQEVNETVS